MSTRRTIRVFISSPSDVRPERLIAERVVKRLAREFIYLFDVEPKMWEREPLVATSDFQDLIVPPSQTDIVVVILWARLGVPLPTPKYLGPVSGREVTGTEYEFEDAFRSFRERQVPDLLLYRKNGEPEVKLGSREDIEEKLCQKEAVEDFMHRWTRDASGRSFSAAYTTFESATDFETLVEEHLRALLRKRTQGVENAPTVRWHKGSPFRGLEVFEPAHEQVFFGRMRARNELRERLAQQVVRGTAFVLVLGASGSGKSSLVRAGLLPDLHLPGMIARAGLVRDAIVRPAGERDCFDALSAALLADDGLPELAASPLDYDRERLASLLRDAPAHAVHALRQGLAVAGRSAALTPAGEARLMLIVDQLEELFTARHIGAADRERFARTLRVLAESGVVWVVATMRSDFFGQLDQVPILAELAAGNGAYLLVPPDRTELGQIVRQPAREAGLSFEIDQQTDRGLDDTVLAAAEEGSSLPLLEYLLDQLFVRRSSSGVLTFAAYRALGGLEGAVGARAEEVLAAQPADVQSALPAVLRALVTVGEGANANATARYAALDRFSRESAERRLIDALLAPDARLLVADGATLRVAHEALLTHWERARRQIAEDRADLQLRARLEQAAELWKSADPSNRDSLLLAEGLPLSQAEDFLQRRGGELDSALARFIEVSMAFVRRRRRRGVRRLIYVSGALGALALMASMGMLLAYEWFRESNRNLDRAENGLHVSLELVNTIVSEMGSIDRSPEQAKALVKIVEDSLGQMDDRDGDDRVLATRTRLRLVVVPLLLYGEGADVDLAAAYADESFKSVQKLLAASPQDKVIQEWVAYAWGNKAQVLEERSDKPGAIAAYEQTRAAGRVNDRSARLQRYVARANESLALLYEDDAAVEGALDGAVEARQRVTQLAGEHKKPDYLALAKALNKQADWRLKHDKAQPALQSAEASIAAVRPIFDDLQIGEGDEGRTLIDALRFAGEAATAIGDKAGLEQAIEWLEEAKQLCALKDNKGLPLGIEDMETMVDDALDAARLKQVGPK